MARDEKEKEQAKEEREEEEKDECCICLGEIGEVMGCLTCCEHKFCFACISQWAEKSNTCPLCKQRFREIIRKTVGGQQGRKKQKTERVRVRRKDYNPWSEEEDEDDSDDDDLDDEDLHWPPSGFLIDSFSLGSMHAPPLFNHHHHAHHHHHHHALQHNSGFPFSFVPPQVHFLDMFHRLMFDTARSSYAPHGHGHAHSTSTYASSSSSSSGDELLSEPGSPEVILVDSDGEDTSSLERGRTRREQRTAAADIPAPLALPRPRLPAGPAQEVIDLTLLPDSEDDDDGDDETEGDVARRLRRGREQREPLPTVVVNLEASPAPQVREFARRSGGRIADIIHEQDI